MGGRTLASVFPPHVHTPRSPRPCSLQAANKYTDTDLLSFLVNTECLEAEFNSFAAFGVGMHPKLFGLSSPSPMGGKKANLSWDIQLWSEEVGW